MKIPPQEDMLVSAHEANQIIDELGRKFDALHQAHHESHVKNIRDLGANLHTIYRWFMIISFIIGMVVGFVLAKLL